MRNIWTVRKVWIFESEIIVYNEISEHWNVWTRNV